MSTTAVNGYMTARGAELVRDRLMRHYKTGEPLTGPELWACLSGVETSNANALRSLFGEHHKIFGGRLLRYVGQCLVEELGQTKG